MPWKQGRAWCEAAPRTAQEGMLPSCPSSPGATMFALSSPAVLGEAVSQLRACLLWCLLLYLQLGSSFLKPLGAG